MLDTLSPQRRRLVVVIGALVLIGGLGLIAAVTLRSGGAAADQARPGPIVLVPGYGGQLSSLDDIAARLRRTGRTVQEVALPDGGVGDLHAQADAVQRVVGRDLAAGAPSVDLVGYSAGGVTVRLWATESDHAAAARRIVTIGSPQHGTTVASSAGDLLGAACSGACAQLETGSPLLDGLNAGDETPNGPQWLSIWTNDDQTVVPANSARLDGATNLALQSICPADAVAHSQEPRDPAVIGLVTAALTLPQGVPTLPLGQPVDCAVYTAVARGTGPVHDLRVAG